MRLWALLRALAAEGHQMDLVALEQPGLIEQHAAQLREACAQIFSIPFELSNWSKTTDFSGRLRALLDATPYGVARFRNPLVPQRILSLLETAKYDAVIAATPYSLINIPAALPVPLIVDDQNIEHMILRRYLSCERNPAKLAYGWMEWKKLARWEAAHCGRGKVIVVCSDVDRSIMQKMCPGVPVYMVPNIVDTDRYRPSPPPPNRRLLYVGGMDWLPNRDAVEFFAGGVVPELRRLGADFKFAVAYSREHAPTPEFRAQFAAYPEIEFVETANMDATILEASISVVPLRIGSGTRFKILEAAASGRPVVSTRVGAEGLNFVNGSEILLEDEPQGFARAVASLLADAGCRDAMGAAARARVEREYSFEAVRLSLRGVLASLGTQGIPSERQER